MYSTGWKSDEIQLFTVWANQCWALLWGENKRNHRNHKGKLRGQGKGREEKHVSWNEKLIFFLSSRKPKPLTSVHPRPSLHQPVAHKSKTEFRTELQHGLNHMQLARLKDIFFLGPACILTGRKLALPADVATFAAGCSLGPPMLGKVVCSGYKQRQGKGSL